MNKTERSALLKSLKTEDLTSLRLECMQEIQDRQPTPAKLPEIEPLRVLAKEIVTLADKSQIKVSLEVSGRLIPTINPYDDDVDEKPVTAEYVLDFDELYNLGDKQIQKKLPKEAREPRLKMQKLLKKFRSMLMEVIRTHEKQFDIYSILRAADPSNTIEYS